MSDDTKPASPIGVWSLRTAALWLAAGALFKLFLSGPQDLPPVVQDWFGGKETLLLKYRTIIPVELIVALLAILRPRIGWALMVGTFVVFEGILVQMMLAGEESCWCFGGDVPMPPWLMSLIDGVLLVGILLGKPWRKTAAPIGPTWLLVGAVVGSVVGACSVDREAEPPPLGPPGGGAPTGPSGASGVVDGDPDPGTNGAGGPDVEDDGGAWPFHILDPESWVGQDVFSIEQLSGWLDLSDVPPDATVVFYRQTCSHCAEHLRQLADVQANGTDEQEHYVMVRIVERDDTPENEETAIKPQGTLKELPRKVEYALTTPADFKMRGYEVVEGREGIAVED